MRSESQREQHTQRITVRPCTLLIAFSFVLEKGCPNRRDHGPVGLRVSSGDTFPSRLRWYRRTRARRICLGFHDRTMMFDDDRSRSVCVGI